MSSNVFRNRLHGALLHLHLEYGMQVYSPSLVADTNHEECTEKFATRLVTGFHLPYEDKIAAATNFG